MSLSTKDDQKRAGPTGKKKTRPASPRAVTPKMPGKKAKSTGGAAATSPRPAVARPRNPRRAAAPQRAATIAQDRNDRRAAACFQHLGKRAADGDFSCLVATAAAAHEGWTLATARLECVGGAGATSVNAHAARVRRAASPRRCRQLSETLEAAAGPHRIAILAKLLEGPATYQALQKATGLKVGPLYHHINRLRLAQLVAPKERDLYRLTRAGRNLLVVLLAALPLLTDTRPLD